jgi:hypothetical protein
VGTPLGQGPGNRGQGAGFVLRTNLIPGLGHPNDEDLSSGTPESETWGTRESLRLSEGNSRSWACGLGLAAGGFLFVCNVACKRAPGAGQMGRRML